MVLVSHLMGLVPEFKYLSVNWLICLNVSERAVLHPFCTCMIDISHIMGYTRVTYSFKDVVQLFRITAFVDREEFLQAWDEGDYVFVCSGVDCFLVVVPERMYV